MSKAGLLCPRCQQDSFEFEDIGEGERLVCTECGAVVDEPELVHGTGKGGNPSAFVKMQPEQLVPLHHSPFLCTSVPCVCTLAKSNWQDSTADIAVLAHTAASVSQVWCSCSCSMCVLFEWCLNASCLGYLEDGQPQTGVYVAAHDDGRGAGEVPQCLPAAVVTVSWPCCTADFSFPAPGLAWSSLSSYSACSRHVALQHTSAQHP